MKCYTNEELEELSKQDLIAFIWKMQNKLWKSGQEIIELEKRIKMSNPRRYG